jgi:hypothetical protein
VKIIATNYYGDSIYSDAGAGAIIWVVPDAPINIFNDAAVTDATQIKFTFTEGLENGATPVLDYNIFWDMGAGNDVYTLLESNLLTTYYTTTVELTPDVIYSFKIQARNAVGVGEQSLSISIRAARIPDAPVSLADVPEITSAW